MNKNTFHFQYLRLNVAPQTMISSLHYTPGFITREECEQFCASIGFSYTIFYIDEYGKFINSKFYK